MEYYTYIWRDANGSPFYVGKGKGRRAYDVTSRSKAFTEVHARGGCSVEISDWFLHESQALADEMELIERYGRQEYGGLLVNKTDGGDGATGCSPSAETRAKISFAKRSLSESGRANLSEALSGRKLSQAHRAKIGAAGCNRVLNPESLTKMSESMRRLCPRGQFKGTTFDRARGKWSAEIKTDSGRKYLGRFATQEDAARAYDAAAFSAWGHDCYLNFPEELGCIGEVRRPVVTGNHAEGRT